MSKLKNSRRKTFTIEYGSQPTSDYERGFADTHKQQDSALTRLEVATRMRADEFIEYAVRQALENAPEACDLHADFKINTDRHDPEDTVPGANITDIYAVATIACSGACVECPAFAHADTTLQTAINITK